MITETTSAATIATTSTTVKAESKTNALTSDFETFLKMLTAQARFQDPLEPIDSTEYAAQLAQFSMVEQQVQTNENLDALFSVMGVQNAASLSAWVGMEARAIAPATFSGQPVPLSINPDRLSDSVALVVRDSAGLVVQRLPVDPSADQFDWSGKDEGGATLPFGTYSFEIENVKAGQVSSTSGASVYARVTEAQIQGSEVMLIFEGGQTVPASSVTALRNPA